MAIIQPVITGGGTTPTGTLPITNNGTYDVTNYASADVNVPTTAPALYREFQIEDGKLIPNKTTTHIMNFTGITSVDAEMLAYAYYKNHSITGVVDMSDIQYLEQNRCAMRAFMECTGITGVDLSSLKYIGYSNRGTDACNWMFNGCSNLVTANLSSLTHIYASGSATQMLANCPLLTTVNIGNLKEIWSSAATYMFASDTSLQNISLDSLVVIYDRGCMGMFWSDTGLTNVGLASLTTITDSYTCSQMFDGCTSLSSLSFPSLGSNSFGSYKNQFYKMLNGVTGCTVHFPSNLQSVLSTWSDVTNGFGGTNTTVLYDLPATYTLTGTDTKSYYRNPKYDTATALGWYDKSSTRATPYYTSGTTDPAVSDTIYSDAACTTAVTTISSIA